MSRDHAKPSGGILATVAPYSKAITGAILGAAAMWLNVRSHGVTSDELWQILGAAASGGGLIWAVPNKDPKGKKQDESTQPPDHRPPHPKPNQRVVENNRKRGLT